MTPITLTRPSWLTWRTIKPHLQAMGRAMVVFLTGMLMVGIKVCAAIVLLRHSGIFVPLSPEWMSLIDRIGPIPPELALLIIFWPLNEFAFNREGEDEETGGWLINRVKGSWEAESPEGVIYRCSSWEELTTIIHTEEVC